MTVKETSAFASSKSIAGSGKNDESTPSVAEISALTTSDTSKRKPTTTTSARAVKRARIQFQIAERRGGGAFQIVLSADLISAPAPDAPTRSATVPMSA